MNVSEKILAKLLKIGAIQLRPKQPFTWASGLRSPIYCDNRLSLSFPEIRKLIIEGFTDLMASYEKPDIIIGVATAGIAHGALLAHELDLPFAYVRSKKKEHGRQNAIEGKVSAGQKCIVIEDLISTGGSSIAAAQVLQESELHVLSVLSIFNYNLQSAIDNFQKAKMPYASISDYRLLMDMARRESSFDQSDLDLLGTWSKNPAAWSDHYQENLN